MLRLILRRVAFERTYTIGRLYANGKKICDTMEPHCVHCTLDSTVGFIQRMKKVFGSVAIPVGTFDIVMSPSEKFHQLMPFLQDVHGFSGVMIHPGNYPRDTQGCILVGVNRQKGKLATSKRCFKKVQALIEDSLQSGEGVNITVKEFN